MPLQRGQALVVFPSSQLQHASPKGGHSKEPGPPSCFVHPGGLRAGLHVSSAPDSLRRLQRGAEYYPYPYPYTYPCPCPYPYPDPYPYPYPYPNPDPYPDPYPYP